MTTPMNPWDERLAEDNQDQFMKNFERLLEAARAFRTSMDKHAFYDAMQKLNAALRPFDIPGAEKVCGTCGHRIT